MKTWTGKRVRLETARSEIEALVPREGESPWFRISSL